MMCLALGSLDEMYNLIYQGKMGKNNLEDGILLTSCVQPIGN